MARKPKPRPNIANPIASAADSFRMSKKVGATKKRQLRDMMEGMNIQGTFRGKGPSKGRSVSPPWGSTDKERITDKRYI